MPIVNLRVFPCCGLYNERVCAQPLLIPGNLILSYFMMGLPGGKGVCGGSCFEPLGRWLSWFYPSLGEALALGTHHEHALLSIGTSDALRPACSIRASGHLVCMRSFGLAVGLAVFLCVVVCIMNNELRVMAKRICDLL